MEARFASPPPPPMPPASAGPLFRLLVQKVARAFHVRAAAIVSPGRTGAREALARHAAMYLAHVVLGWSYAEIAALFGRHRTSVHYACARIEDCRDEGGFDALLARLERQLAANSGEPA